MLRSLYIRHLALVDEMTVDFSSGLSVISGETGAGKSLLLNALGLTLGDRFNPVLLAEGEKSGEVVATFSLPKDHVAVHWLREQNIEVDEQCLLRRTFSPSGSRCFINGSPVTVSQMGSFGDMLVELHGQHQHHALLEQQQQQQLYDSYSQLGDSVDAVSQQYREKQRLEKQLHALQESLADGSKRDYLRYQLQELEQLAPLAGEYEQLSEQQKAHAKEQELSDFLQQAGEFVNGNGTHGAITTIGQLCKSARELRFRQCEDVTILLQQLEIQVSELAHQLRELENADKPDAQQMFLLEQRLVQWHDLARKHHVQPAELVQHCEKLKSSYQDLEKNDEKISEIQQHLAVVEETFTQACDTLSERRKRNGDVFSQAVCSVLRELAMPEARFAVQFTQREKPNAHGNEKISYLIQTNRGSKAQSLQSIVSGGELSRISLAIYQTCNQVLRHSRCMIFDEIDAAVSGTVAQKMGQLLRSLGANYQVICITHQPQVVAHSHHHFLATKKTQGHAATTSLQALDDNASVAEIARMLGGEGSREKSLELAKHMYQLAQA